MQEDRAKPKSISNKFPTTRNNARAAHGLSKARSKLSNKAVFAQRFSACWYKLRNQPRNWEAYNTAKRSQPKEA